MGEKLLITGAFGGTGSVFSGIDASSLGASLPLIGAEIVAVTAALYIATCLVQGVSNARNSEKDSMKKVPDDYPMLGYRYQI